MSVCWLKVAWSEDSVNFVYSAATTARPQLQDHQPLLLAWRHHTCLSTLVYQQFQVPQNILEIGTSRSLLALSLSQLPSLPPGRTLMCARNCTSIWPVSAQSSSRRTRHHPRERTWEQLLFSKVPPTCTTLSNAVLTTWRAQMMVCVVYVSYSLVDKWLMQFEMVEWQWISLQVIFRWHDRVLGCVWIILSQAFGGTFRSGCHTLNLTIHWKCLEKSQ